MAQQSWLFEAPVPPARPQHDPLALALAEWAEDESRRSFRRQTLRTISTPAHPLNFLVTQLGKFTNLKTLRVDAGHVIPLRTLKRQGWTTERFVLQDRKMNRSEGGKMGATRPAKRVIAVNVAGVPVERDTLEKWVKNRWLAQKYGQRGYIDAHTIRHREDGHGFALGEAVPRTSWL